MRLLQRILIAAVITISTAATAGGAVAHGFIANAATMLAPASQNYSGNWPVTVTGSQFSNGTYCLTLTANAGNGGSASLVINGQKYPYGSFVVVNRILMATIIKPSGSQNGALTFTAHAGQSDLGQGIFENIEGGSNFDFGPLAFGKKNGC